MENKTLGSSIFEPSLYGKIIFCSHGSTDEFLSHERKKDFQNGSMSLLGDLGYLSLLT
jgi:hypothetical protein